MIFGNAKTNFALPKRYFNEKGTCHTSQIPDSNEAFMELKGIEPSTSRVRSLLPGTIFKQLG